MKLPSTRAGTTPKNSRNRKDKERLAKALRDNLKRRKAAPVSKKP